ncbi:mediator of DNA damage checkpoint protein 1-like isoform X4 [Toxotes jaculatrix]|uniref:mediator of DNA damage checkpoint protein 1-like isoform X4 n=1 Tax=Toxotes jaculatrix TaxID=941984 RepID=UPI001B3AEB87|nr:mediator of DNA damage checkpoint protein 1-like isoform X4 [Toxotes jaculatrix]
MSLQVCYCGWSKVTTYHGLRTHQGKMGCTPKGVMFVESELRCQWEHVDIKLDFYATTKTETTDVYSDMKVYACHCGWEKVTTYRGLRIHQGKRGCTPKGMRIPEKEQEEWKNQWKMKVKTEADEWRPQSAQRRTVKEEDSPELKPAAAAAARIREGYKSTSATSQRSSQRATRSGHHPQDFSALPQANKLVKEPPVSPPPVTAVRGREKKTKHQTSSQIPDIRSQSMKEHQVTNYSCYDDAPAARIKEEPKPSFAAPQPPFHRVTQSKSGHQLQDFSIHPQTADGRAMAENQSIVRRRESAPKASIIKEEPQSPFVTPQCFSQRPTNSNAGRRLQNFSTGVQVNSLVREHPTAVYPATALRPKEKHREDQTFQEQNAPVPSNISSPATATTTEEPIPPVPSRPFQSATYPESGSQLQDFSTDAQVNGSASEHPPPALPATLLHQKKKDRKDVASQERVKPDLQENIEERKEKKSSITPTNRACENGPRSTSRNSKHNTTKEHPKPNCETAPPDTSTGMKVKELARMFSAIITKEAAERPTEEHREKQTQVKPLTQKFSATAAQETAKQLQPKGKDREDQKLSQTVPESTSISQTNSAAAEATTQDDPKSLGESAQPGSSTGMKVKELARMFSATTTQETAGQPKDKCRDKRNLSQVPHSTNATNKMNPAAAAGATTEAEPKSSACETAELSHFPAGMKVKELARMFSAPTTQK